MKLSILAIALLALGASAQAPPADEDAVDNAADQADGVGAPVTGTGPITGGRGIFQIPGEIDGRIGIGGRGLFIVHK